MATISSRALIDELIKSNGKDPHPLEPGERPDPDVAMIVEYTTSWGHTAWGVTWVNESRERQECSQLWLVLALHRCSIIDVKFTKGIG